MEKIQLVCCADRTHIRDWAGMLANNMAEEGTQNKQISLRGITWHLASNATTPEQISVHRKYYHSKELFPSQAQKRNIFWMKSIIHKY